MYQKIQDLLNVREQITLILNNGFERRATRGAELIRNIKLKPKQVVLLKYSEQEDDTNYEKIAKIRRNLTPATSEYCEINSYDVESLDAILATLDRCHDRVVCDITGLSRYLIMVVLTRLYARGVRFSLIYTEAKEYYPKIADFRPLLRLDDLSEAFKQLTNYEHAEIVYSSNCEIQEVPELRGRIFPNHPVMLVAFLAFKRSRLSCVLNQFETNARILIQSVPVRHDLKWREKALEIINCDLIDENKSSVVRLSTLGWRQTYTSLTELYSRNDNRYRFNVLLAPLGSKMQTVGAWYFAVKNQDVKVITSTPKRHFPGKYSIGFTDTHLIAMDCIYGDEKQEVGVV